MPDEHNYRFAALYTGAREPAWGKEWRWVVGREGGRSMGHGERGEESEYDGLPATIWLDVMGHANVLLEAEQRGCFDLPPGSIGSLPYLRPRCRRRGS